jgi:hypothetical protein
MYKIPKAQQDRTIPTELKEELYSKFTYFTDGETPILSNLVRFIPYSQKLFVFSSALFLI